MISLYSLIFILLILQAFIYVIMFFYKTYRWIDYIYNGNISMRWNIGKYKKYDWLFLYNIK